MDQFEIDMNLVWAGYTEPDSQALSKQPNIFFKKYFLGILALISPIF